MTPALPGAIVLHAGLMVRAQAASGPREVPDMTLGM